MLNAPQQGAQLDNGNQMGTGKNAMGNPGRQYYPYQGSSGYGNVQGLNYPYAGAGLGSYQYGQGQCN